MQLNQLYWIMDKGKTSKYEEIRILSTNKDLKLKI